MAEEALKIEENEELEVPTGGIGDFVMEDDEIEEVYGDDSEVDAKADFGDDGIAQFPALAELTSRSYTPLYAPPYLTSKVLSAAFLPTTLSGLSLLPSSLGFRVIVNSSVMMSPVYELESWMVRVLIRIGEADDGVMDSTLKGSEFSVTTSKEDVVRRELT